MRLRSFHISLRMIVTMLILGSMTAIGTMTFAMEKETHDDFCASCHTQPESDFYQRSIERTRAPLDLAASHARKDRIVHCIDCHGGHEPIQRLRTFFGLAVWDTIKFWTGNYDQPARLSSPLSDANCLYCHKAAVAAPGFENHFHTRLNDPGAPVLPCTSCHASHIAADSESRFILRRIVFPQCNTCHRTMGKGPSDLR